VLCKRGISQERLPIAILSTTRINVPHAMMSEAGRRDREGDDSSVVEDMIAVCAGKGVTGCEGKGVAGCFGVGKGAVIVCDGEIIVLSPPIAYISATVVNSCQKSSTEA
jgi:hypothetical protein